VWKKKSNDNSSDKNNSGDKKPILPDCNKCHQPLNLNHCDACNGNYCNCFEKMAYHQLPNHS